MGSTAPTAPSPGTTVAAPARIRKARLSDAPAVAALGAAVFTHTFADSGCTPEQLQQFLAESYSDEAIAKDIADPSKELIVAVGPAGAGADAEEGEGDGEVLGFVLLTRGSHVEEPCVRDLEAPVELQRLYVGLGQHGRGVGRALSEAVVRLAEEEGFKHMWLGVWEENHRAQRFYANMGFTRVGEHVFDVGGDLQTDHILFKAL